MKQPTVDVQTVYGIGTVSLDVSWKTVGPATTDRVVITHVAGSGGCYDFEQTLQQSAAQTQTQTGFNEYTHQITWDDRDCHPNCVFDVRVYSDNPVASSWSLKERIKITSCIGGF